MRLFFGPPGFDPATEGTELFPPYRGLRFGLSLSWLLVGAGFYAVVLALTMARYADPADATLPVIGPSLYLTPLFGAPYVLATLFRPGAVRRLLFFFVAVPLAHVAANYAAFEYGSLAYMLRGQERAMRILAAGAIGGTIGAAFSLLMLQLMQLAPRRNGYAPLTSMALATLALGILGALAMGSGVALVRPIQDIHDASRQILWYQCVHLPWQIGFALALAWLMRPQRLPAGTR